MKRFLCSWMMALLLFLAAAAIPGMPSAAVSAEAAPPEPVQVSVPMSDGVTLAASIYQPDGKPPAGGWPAVIMIHGWGGDRNTYNTIAPFYAQNGYVVLTYDCRGFGQSEGKTSLAGPREIQDLHELMQYIIDHFQVDGDKIGSTGISYGGGQSYLLAASNNQPGYTGPKVKAIAPVMGWTDLNDALLPNDVMKGSYNSVLLAMGFKPDKLNYGTDLPAWFVEGLSGLNQADFKQQLALRSVKQHSDQLGSVPIYALQAWKDELFPVQQVRSLFSVLQLQNPDLKLYAGGYGHPGAVMDENEENYVFTQALAWFDYWLQGKQNGIMKRDNRVLIGTEYWPKGQVYELSTGNLQQAAGSFPQHIVQYPSWPQTAKEARYLAAGRLLAENVSSSPELMVNNPTTGPQNDPVTGTALPGTGSLAATQTVTAATALHYRLPANAADTAVLGPVHVSLWLSSTSPNPTITARIFDVAEDGTKTLVTRGASRANGLGITVPGHVQFDLFDAHHVFRQGHTLELELSPSDTPFFVADAETVGIRLHHDTGYPSSVEIPVWSGN